MAKAATSALAPSDATTTLKRPTPKPRPSPVVPKGVPVAPAFPDEPATPATPAPKVLAFGSTSFKMDFSTALPDVPLVSTRTPELPFRGWFAEALACLTPQNSQVHIYLPNTFWTEHRKVDATALKASYVKGKLRNAFSTWRDGDKDKRSVLELLIYDRPNGLPGEDESPGYSVWLRLKK